MNNSKEKLLYWIPTGLLVVNFALGGASTLLKSEGALDVFRKLGYPDYFAAMLGTAQLLGAAALLLPAPRTVREWAYAGLSFDCIAAAISLLAVGMTVYHLGFPIFILALILTSHWSWRRRLALAKN